MIETDLSRVESLDEWNVSSALFESARGRPQPLVYLYISGVLDGCRRGQLTFSVRELGLLVCMYRCHQISERNE